MSEALSAEMRRCGAFEWAAKLEALEEKVQYAANAATDLARQLRVAEARIEALENWGEDAEGALIYASTILGSYAKDGNPAELAEGECDRVFAHWVTRRTGGDIMSSRGNLEWYDKNVKTPRVLELEARIKALEKDIRQLCWNIPEGSNYLICEFCAAEVEDGADQVTLDAAHEPGCRAALAAKENRP